MDFQTAVRHQIELLNQGRPLEAFDRYFSDEGRMFDNDEQLGSGKEECRAKQESFVSRAADIIGKISHCAVDVEDSICVFHNQSTFIDEAGVEHDVNGIHWQRWVAGKIVEERCYRGEAMVQKVAEGILEAGTPTDLAEAEVLPPHAEAEAQRLRAIIGPVLEGLVKDEHIELAPDSTELLTNELIMAAFQARNPRHAIKKLRNTLMQSDHVEEVYGSDSVLDHAFRSALGG